MYNILVCDDEKDIVNALDIYLKSEGYNTILAYNGNEAIEKVKKELAKEKVNIYINDMNNIGVSYEDAIKYLQELGGNK